MKHSNWLILVMCLATFNQSVLFLSKVIMLKFVYDIDNMDNLV